MRYFKDNISEGYSDVIEIEKLAKDILKNKSKIFANVIYFLFKNKDEFDSVKSDVYFNYKKEYLKNIVNFNNYNKLKQFINNFDLNIKFTKEDMGYNDAQYIKSESLIKLNGRSKDLSETLTEFKNNILKINNKDDIFKISEEILIDVYKISLVHELQHAYDDYRTDGKFVYHKKTQDFFKKFKNNNLKTKEDFIQYLNVPHEFWAKYSETVSNFTDQDWEEDFMLLLKGFRDNFIGYKTLNDKTKRRLIKALYKLYTLKRNKND
jgi:hypothetical protein